MVVCGGRETCAPDYQIDRETGTFPYYAFEWVERGRGEVWLRGRRHELEPGSLFCYGPGVPCRIRTDPEYVLTKVFVDVAGTEAEDLLGQVGLTPGQHCRLARIVELSEVFDGMYREGLRHGPDVHAIVATYFRLLLLKARDTASAPQPGGTQRLETFLRCRQFLQDHYLQFTSIEAAAQELDLTPSYLCRLFREFGERSPYQFLLRVRMNHAPRHPDALRRLREARLLRVRLPRPCALLSPLQAGARPLPPRPRRPHPATAGQRGGGILPRRLATGR